MVVRLRQGYGGMLVLLALALGARPAYALLGQTASDLAMLEDSLKSALETEPGFESRVLPMLLATPVHHWVESRSDFSAESTRVLKDVFTGPNDIINCPDCDAWRLHIREGQGLDIDNGEIGLAELTHLKQDPRYGGAKSLALISETPAGVELRIIDLTDGRILYERVADSSERLGKVKPWLGYQEERDRRLRGESLSYVWFNLGVFPQPRIQLEFLEQWGDRNQHISGVGISLLNPNAALGFVYHYMIPSYRRLTLGGALYFPLQGIIQNAFNNSSTPANTVVGQAMVEISFANSVGAFASVSSDGVFSIGLNFYNPLFMPFLL